MEYREEIIDHYKNPRNFGEMEDADVTINEANASCGDVVQIQVKMGVSGVRLPHPDKIGVRNDEKVIMEMRWRGVGCAISTAAASMLSEKVVGMKVKDISKIGEEGIKRMMGGEINLGRMKCATLAYRGLLKVFENNG
jgi:nitrogen fixation NifU-like protein